MNIKQYDFYYKIRTLPFVDAIYLYGSRAKNESRLRSDIDLAILCPAATALEWQQVRALEKFADAITWELNQFPYVREAVIQIFEYNFELYWKLLKKICLQEGFETVSPRSTFERAYALQLIADENRWLEMMEDRNLTSHTYRQRTAHTIYEHCKHYVPIMQMGYETLRARYQL